MRRKNLEDDVYIIVNGIKDVLRKMSILNNHYQEDIDNDFIYRNQPNMMNYKTVSKEILKQIANRYFYLMRSEKYKKMMKLQVYYVPPDLICFLSFLINHVKTSTLFDIIHYTLIEKDNLCTYHIPDIVSYDFLNA